MRALLFILKLLLKIAVAPVILVLTVFIWLCAGLVYVSGLVLGLISMVFVLLGVAVLITYSPQNGIILMIGVPHQPVWSAQSGDLVAGQSAGFEICHSGQGVWIKYRGILRTNIRRKPCTECFTAIYFCAIFVYNGSTKGSDGRDKIRTV